MVSLVTKWKEAARRDDLFNHMVPSDVRLLIKEIERLQCIEAIVKRFLTWPSIIGTQEWVELKEVLDPCACNG